MTVTTPATIIASSANISSAVMAGLDPAAHVFATAGVEGVGTPDKPGHDDVGSNNREVAC
jgi:hypothetical protein